MMITGTNGKGSCAAVCEAILSAQGYKVGCYTSPHLIKFNERIRYNNQSATDEDISRAYQDIDPHLGYFQQATLAALKIFQEKNLDAYILEVGIGGRLDPVNLNAEPDVSVITSIDFDHAERLGNTREAIGFEKAHIFRAHKPAICGDENMPDSVRRYADNIKANLFVYQQDYFFEEFADSDFNANSHAHSGYWNWWNKDIGYKNLNLPKLYLPNVSTALQALSVFPLKISREAINIGLETVFLPGRFQIIEKPILQIFDVAHNAASARLLASNLQNFCRHSRESGNPESKTIAVVGMLKDKDILATIEPLLSSVDIWHLATLDYPRAASSEEMAKFVQHGILYDNPVLAYRAALEKAGPNDRIVVFGSFRTVGEIIKVQK